MYTLHFQKSVRISTIVALFRLNYSYYCVFGLYATKRKKEAGSFKEVV